MRGRRPVGSATSRPHHCGTPSNDPKAHRVPSQQVRSPARRDATKQAKRATASGKGRPTPTRKEAEAAAKARAKVPRTRKEQAAAQRLARSDSSTKMRQAMKTGDERYLPARDRGPVKRFIRDYVDSRFSFVELMIPVLLVTTVMAWSGNAAVASYGNAILFGMLLADRDRHAATEVQAAPRDRQAVP